MKQSFIILLLFAAFTLSSCDRIKNKSKQLADKTEEKVKDKSQELVDKIVPQFDAHTPDTKFNKERFNDFLQVEITPDVKNIYCFDDAIGIDADYQFAFNCDTATARRIIKKHRLALDTETTDNASGLQTDFDWWDKKKIVKLDLYSWKDNQYYKYFWYDKSEQKAYFFDFDM